nr:MAG TPA: Chain length determinant protein [Caudoviricetes sp.]
MFFDEETCKQLDKIEKMVRKIKRRSNLILLTTIVVLGVVAVYDEVTVKRSKKEGE